ncbi:MAG: polysaccharide deacetylase family protein [Saprospiraceae bacterium]|nr:MAG: polysaccharide deacetylase [Bacteroidetes bacterium OLB9]MCO6464955.1 polysaccharide deacetylase family protein [Saprospiraceae bacterium]
MYLVKTPPVIQSLFPDFIWKIDTHRKEVFLTFDDGPIPELTDWILDTLHSYDFKATFFCVGENVKKHPEIYQRILANGHAVGNHTYNHLKGWTTDTETYINNIKKCDEWVRTDLFRPPYGKLKPSQSSALKMTKSIIMWDVLSGDFDLSITKEKCLSNVMNNYSAGSIIVFHDNIKAEEKLKFVLPRFLDHLAECGYRSESLEYALAEMAI